jgi:hypothetical protein
MLLFLEKLLIYEKTLTAYYRIKLWKKMSNKMELLFWLTQGYVNLIYKDLKVVSFNPVFSCLGFVKC